jgi:hypothetical protein
MPTPTDVLFAFSQKQANDSQVMRALVEHDDWYLPVHALLEPKVNNLVVYAKDFSVRTDRLAVFTTRHAADQAAQAWGGAAMGVYGGGIRGVELFGTLERPALAAATELVVDAASGQERMWFIKRSGFRLSAAWAGAVRLERELERFEASTFAALKAAQGLWVPMAKSDQTLVQLETDTGPHALVFTAPDRYEAFLEQLGPRADQVKPTVVDGAQLFPFLLGTKLSGVLVNARIPLSREVLQLVVEA